MDREAIFEPFNPAQTGGIVLNLDSTFVLPALYARACFQEVAARPADIRLSNRGLWAVATSRTNKADTKQCEDRYQTYQTHGTSTQPGGTNLFPPLDGFGTYQARVVALGAIAHSKRITIRKVARDISVIGNGNVRAFLAQADVVSAIFISMREQMDS
jgi:hypothetical protein